MKNTQTEKENIGIEPCPFCSSNDTAVTPYWRDSWFFVACLNGDCGAHGPERNSAELSIAAWNQRSKQEG